MIILYIYHKYTLTKLINLINILVKIHRKTSSRGIIFLLVKMCAWNKYRSTNFNQLYIN